jgi:hypothetical protein
MILPLASALPQTGAGGAADSAAIAVAEISLGKTRFNVMAGVLRFSFMRPCARNDRPIIASEPRCVDRT